MMNQPPSQPTVGNLADQIMAREPHAALRLKQLESAVNGGPSADAWAATSIHQLVAPANIVERSKEDPSVTRRLLLPTWVSVLEWIRNFLVLMPLVVTWVGIAVAVAGYHDLLQAEPNADDTFYPFLALWQDGFKGHLFLDLTLNKLAITDASILAVVVVLTAIVSWYNNVRYGKAEADAERAEAQAMRLEADLDHALAYSSLQLATRRWSQPTNFVDRFETAAQRLLGLLEAERQQLKQLASDKSEELKALKVLTPALEEAAKGIQEAVTALTKANTHLTTTLDEANAELKETINLLIEPAKEISTQQQQLMPIVQGAFDRLGEVTTKQEDFLTLQENWGREFQQVMVTLSQTADQSVRLAGQISSAVDQHAQFLLRLEGDLNAQGALATQVETANLGLKEGLESIRDSAISLRDIAVNMHDLAGRMVSLPSDMRDDFLLVLKEHSLNAAKIGEASDRLAKVPEVLYQWLNYWNSRNGAHS
ncbi:MAG TPA: hypothetical protein VH540_07575 [Ktedonobacterales bacterium]